MTEIYVDGDACPVREEIYRVAARLELDVFVVSNGSRPIRPPGTSNVRMVLVGESADAADDWIAEHISADDVCVTSEGGSRGTLVPVQGDRDRPKRAEHTVGGWDEQKVIPEIALFAQQRCRHLWRGAYRGCDRPARETDQDRRSSNSGERQ